VVAVLVFVVFAGVVPKLNAAVEGFVVAVLVFVVFAVLVPKLNADVVGLVVLVLDVPKPGAVGLVLVVDGIVPKDNPEVVGAIVAVVAGVVPNENPEGFAVGV
jgi:hypothetical protein